MADILIRGMEMPKNCLYCPCVRIINDQSVFCYALPSCTDDYNGGEVASGLTTDDLLDRTGRVKTPSWCPLVPLPEGHGRLIDADELFDVMGQDTDRWLIDDISYIETDDAISAVYKAPTIVPAEGGGE